MNATSKLVKAWESKNAKNAAKAGGISLMALSLAACGGSSSTTTTTPVVETPVVDTPAVGNTVALTDATNILTASSFTALADSITADQDTYGAADVIVEDNAGDGDTLTISTDADITATPTVVSIENIVVNVNSLTTGGDSVLTMAVDSIASGEVTFNSTRVATTTDSVTVTGAGNIALVAGANIDDTFDVTMVEDAATTVDAGEATTVNITAVGDDQVATLTLNGDAAGTVDVATDLNITSTAAATWTVTAIEELDTITGDANTTIDIAGLATLSEASVTGVAGVVGGAGTSDLTGVDAPITVDTGAAASFTVADAASFELDTVEAGNTVFAFLAADDDDEDSDVEQSLTVTLSDDTTDAHGAAGGGYTVTLTDSADDGSNEITTLNLVATGDLNHAASADGDVGVDVSDNVLASTINVSGAGDIDMVVTTASTNDTVTLNAAALTGSLIVTATAEMLDVTGGSGDDSITALTAVENDLDGGTGSDTLVLAANMEVSTFTGFETMSGTGDFLSSQLNGLEIVAATGATVTINASGIDSATIDLSGIEYIAGVTATGVVMTGATIDATLLLADTDLSITGTNGADTLVGDGGDDTIVGGTGVDTINGDAGADTLSGGEGADVITGGTGADVISLTETTAAIDNVIFDQGDGSAVGVAGGSFTGFDVVTGFTLASDTVEVSTITGFITESVVAQTAATTAANDLADAEFDDVDAVLAFLNDGGYTDSNTTTADIEAVAVTFSDFTAVYLIDNDTTSALTVGEIELLGTFDAILTATELV